MNKNSPAYVVGFMVLLCLVCGAGLSFVQFMMKPMLDANELLVRNRTINRAYGVIVSEKTAAAYDSALRLNITETTFTADGREWQLLTGKKPPHDVGFIFRGMAFWDYLTGIIVLSDDLTRIRSLDFIIQLETPGLGARIEEQSFKDQFREYPLQWDRPQSELIKFGETRSGKRIDAITGATQTTIALERILNTELAAYKKMRDTSANKQGKE